MYLTCDLSCGFSVTWTDPRYLRGSGPGSTAVRVGCHCPTAARGPVAGGQRGQPTQPRYAHQLHLVTVIFTYSEFHVPVAMVTSDISLGPPNRAKTRHFRGPGVECGCSTA